MSMEPNYTTISNDRLDKICKRRYGTENKRNVEKVLEANRGLADYGPLFPAGVEIYLPDIATPSAVKPTKKLWT